MGLFNRNKGGSGGHRHNAALSAGNGTSWLLGVLITVMALGPAYSMLVDPFVGYVAGYYGVSLSGLAGVFLFVLLLALIFTLSTFLVHTLIEALRAKIVLFLSTFK